ncbi:centrosomal protein of 135 kDa [Saccoglossus kowalevskii]|uniref:Centrosomal protein of 135 kDa n=1 Tax=Saccoglossus kowalevskii TaxID=10224 RepID=A0ABM0MAC0_SACKO|nr:PREDICTED: centrosomal protein of 135 kDa [Saccoglossus kowalevskii]
MSTTVERKFTTLRKRLDQLGYRHPLGIESLPLVERLFSDLVHTTESLKNAKLQASKSVEQTGDWEVAVEPYRSDNAKLVKENNELHLQLIKTKEEAESSIKDLKTTIRRIEHENADLRFLNTQYIHKVRAVEKESKLKTDRINELQEKNFHAVVQTPGGRKRNIPFRRQRMEIDGTVPATDSTLLSSTQSQGEDPYVADLIRVADTRIDALQKDVDKLKIEDEKSKRTVRSLKKQVDARDQEIDRLNRQLEGGRPYDVVSTESKNRGNERLISHLNTQIDYLQQANRDLEKRLKDTIQDKHDANIKVRSLSSKNEELISEMKDIDRLAKQLQTDKDVAITAADRDVTEVQKELQQSTREADSLELELQQLRVEHKNIIMDKEQLASEASIRKQEIHQLKDLLDRVQEDKRRLSDKVNKLTSNERELVLELERLRLSPTKRSKSPSRVEGIMRKLEEERDYFKGEVEVLQKILKDRSLSSSTRSRSRSRSPTKGSPSKRSTSSSPSRAKSPSRCRGSAHYETIIRVLEDERDFYKREYELLRALRIRSSSPSRFGSLTPTRDRSIDEDTELYRLKRERDELQVLLDKFERHMSEIQSNVKVLTADRDKTNMLYEQANDELQRFRREVMKSPKSPRASLAAQSILRRIEHERDETLADLRRMTTERDSLRERLKIATETQLRDRARIEQRLEDLENAVRNTEQERSELQSRVTSMREMIATLEDQIKSQQLKISEANEDCAQHRATATQMRLLAEQAERSLEDHQRRLNKKSGELQASQELSDRLEKKLGEVSDSNSANRGEIAQLRGTIASLDREKDILQVTVDEKTEKIVALETELLDREAMVNEMRMSLSDLDGKLGQYSDEVTSKEREVRSLRRQLDGLHEELTETGRGREVALRENRRQQDDLSTMTRENQTLNQELEEAIRDRETLKVQIQDYISEVSRIEELLAAKEQENRDLLDNYRQATSEAERWESEATHREGEASSVRLELMTKDSELRRYRDRLDQQDQEIQQHMAAQQAYEMQVSSLTKSLSIMEENLRQSQEEKEAILLDLSSVRELCVKLENTKESLSRQLTAKNIESDQIVNQTDVLQREVESLRSQLSSERDSIRNLEGLLSNNREKEFQTQIENQEQRSDIQLMRDKLSLSDSKVQSQTREIHSLRTRTAQLESELERIRRQLTSERFERERVSQELRRVGLTPPPLADTSGRLSRTSLRSGSPDRSYRSPDRSILRSPDRYRSSSADRSRAESPYLKQSNVLMDDQFDQDDIVSGLHNLSYSGVDKLSIDENKDRYMEKNNTSYNSI